jgi:2-C-methyl-D-erythritol 4-phosphate cytidylyltransferase
VSLTGFVRGLIGSGTGVFAYLISRDENKSKVELELARQQASTALISQLPDGAVFRESTANGWREIWMPPSQTSQLIVLPSDAARPCTHLDMPDALPSTAVCNG